MIITKSNFQRLLVLLICFSMGCEIGQKNKINNPSQNDHRCQQLNFDALLQSDSFHDKELSLSIESKGMILKAKNLKEDESKIFLTFDACGQGLSLIHISEPTRPY